MAGKAVQICTILVILLSAGCRHKVTNEMPRSYAVDKTYERGPLTARLRIDQDKINIAQTLLLELEAQFPSQYRPQMPRIDPVLNDLGLVDWDSPPDRLADDGRLIRTVRYRLEPIVSGSFQIPAFEFRFVDANDPNAIYTLQTEPVEIHVASLLPQDRERLTIDDIEPVVEVRSAWRSLWLAAIMPVVLAGGLIAWLYLRRSKARPVVPILRPAHELAYQRLQALLDQRLLDAGMVKEFYEGLSHVLRHYIEDRFQIHAPEQTTEEFLHNLRQTELLAAHERSQLAEFLNHCDLVKFARLQPTTDQIQRSFDLAKGFIEKTRSDQHLVEVCGEGRW